MIPTPQQIAACRVLVVGDVMLDSYFFGTVDRISPEAPVPVVRVHRQEERLGGAANVALNARKLGAQVSLLSVTGFDDAGDRIETMLSAHGIGGVLRDSSGSTVVKMRVIGRAQQMVRVDFEARPTEVALAQLLEAFEQEIDSYDVVLFSDYGKGTLRNVGAMISAARENGVTVLVDPKGSDYRKYTGAHVITPNTEEMKQVCGPWKDNYELVGKANQLRGAAFDAVVIKRSEEGMTVLDASGPMHIPAQVHEVYDVTGAGDTVLAVLGVLMGCGMSVREAAPLANRAGGIVVGKFGTATVAPEELFA